MSAIPDFRVEVNGRDITPVLREARPGNRARPRLISLGLTDKRGSEADQLDLVIDDSDGGVELPPPARRSASRSDGTRTVVPASPPA
ncbi:hypothetical protein ACVOMT_03485 [Sphingomonas panni]